MANRLAQQTALLAAVGLIFVDLILHSVVYKQKCWFINQSDDLTNVWDSCIGLWKRCNAGLCNSWATGSIITFDLPIYILTGRILMGIALGLLYLCFVACIFSLECVLLFRFRSVTKTRLLTLATVIMLLILLCQVATAVLVITHIFYDVFHNGGMDWGNGITNCVWACALSFGSLVLLSCAIYQKRNKSTDFEVPPSFPPPYLHPLGIPLKEHFAPVVTLSPAPPSYKSSNSGRSHSSSSHSSRRRARSPIKLPRSRSSHQRSHSASGSFERVTKEPMKIQQNSRTLTQPQRRKLHFQDHAVTGRQIQLPMTGIQNKSYL